MDYAKQDSMALAKLVFSGSKQLEELPVGRRNQVGELVDQLEAKAKAELKKKTKNKSKGKKKGKKNAAQK